MKEFIIKVTKEAGKILMDNLHSAKIIQYKTPKSVVTNADIASEKYILSKIEKRFPKHSILAEETGFINKKSDYTWFVDPLDGTTPYSLKLPYFCVSIAVAFKNKVINAAVYNPYTKELWYADKNNAFLNNKKIKVSKLNDIEKANILFNYSTRNKEIKKTAHYLTKLIKKTRVHIMHSLELNLCSVASGRSDGCVVYGTNPWDIAAGAFIVEKASGKVSEFNNKQWNPYSNTLVASNKLLYSKIMKILKSKP